MQPTIKQISKHLLFVLEPFGIFLWHVSKHKSIYLKFKDTRLGSIRIADHNARERYNYRYEIYSDTVTQQDIDNITQDIISTAQAQWNPDFDPKAFIIYDSVSNQYVEVADYNAYRSAILTKSN